MMGVDPEPTSTRAAMSSSFRDPGRIQLPEYMTSEILSSVVMKCLTVNAAFSHRDAELNDTFAGTCVGQDTLDRFFERRST